MLRIVVELEVQGRIDDGWFADIMIRQPKGYLYFILFTVGTLKTEYIAVNFSKMMILNGFCCVWNRVFRYFLGN